MPETPTTEAGRTLESRLAYDKDPAHYEHGDYFIEYRPLILAIEAEAAARVRLGPSWREAMDYEQGFEAGAAAERERLRGKVEGLPVYRYILPTDDETTPTRTHRPFDMVRRADVHALLADPAEPEPTANPRLTTPDLAEPEPSDA